MREPGKAPDEPDEGPLPGRQAARAAFARSWVRAVAHANFLPGGRARARAVLEALTDRLVAAIAAEPFDEAAGYPIGTELVAANVSSPAALGASITLLSQRLLTDLGVTDPAAPARLPELLGQLIVGFTEAQRDRALAAAEGINRAQNEAWRDKQRALQDQLQRALLHDALTGLPNRAELTRFLRGTLTAPTAGQRLGICLIHLQRFTAVNDTLGHDTGDQLLLAVAHRLRQLSVRGGYYLAHLGGNEFVFVIEHTAAIDDVAKLADKALNALPDPWLVDGHEIPVSAKAGIIERAAAGADPCELLRAADMALSWAKMSHKRWEIFEPRRNAIDVARHRLSNAMPGALKRGEFALAYQPLIRLADGCIVGAEALARWRHPTRGAIRPIRFIPLAEQTGLIVALSQYLFELACAQAAAWQTLTRTPPMISVNLTVTQLRQPALPATIAAILDRSGLPPGQLQLEITEDAVVEPDNANLATLRTLADLGIRLAIDDFGTGYSNLANLANLPVHGLKIDRSFLTGLTEPGSPGANATILPRIIQLGHDLDLSVTAEGVESAAQQRRLTELGCDIGQGYHLGRPMAPEKLTRLIRG